MPLVGTTGRTGRVTCSRSLDPLHRSVATAKVPARGTACCGLLRALIADGTVHGPSHSSGLVEHFEFCGGRSASQSFHHAGKQPVQPPLQPPAPQKCSNGLCIHNALRLHAVQTVRTPPFPRFFAAGAGAHFHLQRAAAGHPAAFCGPRGAAQCGGGAGRGCAAEGGRRKALAGRRLLEGSSSAVVAFIEHCSLPFHTPCAGWRMWVMLQMPAACTPHACSDALCPPRAPLPSLQQRQRSLSACGSTT